MLLDAAKPEGFWGPDAASGFALQLLVLAGRDSGFALSLFFGHGRLAFFFYDAASSFALQLAVLAGRDSSFALSLVVLAHPSTI